MQGRPAASCPRVREWVSGFFVFEGVVGAGASFPVWESGSPGGGVLTPSIRGASTCPMSPSPALTRPRCVGLTGLALRSRGGGSDPTARCWLAVSSVPAGGVAGAAVRAWSVTVRSGDGMVR